MMQRLKIVVNGRPYVVEVADPTASPLTVAVNGKQYTVAVEAPETGAETAAPTPPRPAADSASKQIKAPMPGVIMNINVKPGDKVSFGQPLCALEAMKMKSAIRSPREGVVAGVEVSEGQGVAYGDLLITFE